MSSICFSHLLGDGERDLLDGLLDGDLLPLGLARHPDDDLLLGDLDLLAGVLVLLLLAGVLDLTLLAGVLVLALGGGDGDDELSGSMCLPLLIPACMIPVEDLVDMLLLPGGGGDALRPGGGGDGPLARDLDLLAALALRAAS